MSARSCRTCDYFDAVNRVCRFNAPIAYASDGDPSVRAHWPIVQGNDWCGEWTVSTTTVMAKPPLWRRMLTSA